MELIENRWISLVSALVPIVYIWSLPNLYAQGFSAPGCGRINRNPCGLGHTVSNFIETTEATGAMAGAFMPTVILLFAMFYDQSDQMGRALLWTASVGFALFLSTPVSKYKQLHISSVATMAVAFIGFYLHTLLAIRAGGAEYAFLGVSTASFVALAIVLGIQKKTVDTGSKKNKCGALNLCKHRSVVWFLECLGLTGFLLILPLLAFRRRLLLS